MKEQESPWFQISNIDQIVRDLRRGRSKEETAISKWIEELYKSGRYVCFPEKGKLEGSDILSLSAIRMVTIHDGGRFGASAAGFGPKAERSIKELVELIQESPEVEPDELGKIIGFVANSGAKIASAMSLFEKIGSDETISALYFPMIFLSETLPLEAIIAITVGILKTAKLPDRHKIVFRR